MKLFLSLALILISGCSTRHVAISSIEDISTENDKALPFINFDQQRSVHTGGLLPHYSVGQMYVPPSSYASFSPSKFVGVSDETFYLGKTDSGGWVEISENSYLDSLAENPKLVARPTRSKVISATYEPTADATQIKSIVSLFSAVKLKSVEYVNARYSAALLKDQIAEKADIETKLQSSSDKKLSARKAELESLIGAKTSAQADQLVRDAKLALSQAEDAFERNANQGNMIIARWDSESSSRWITYLSALATLDFSKKENRSGYVLLNGVRISTLLLGTDIHYTSYPTTLNWDRPVVTTLWQTKSAVAIADLEVERKLEATLEASYEQLKHLDDTLKDLEKIEIEATFRSLQKLTNNSWINAPTIDVENLDWSSISSGLAADGGDGNWATFYAILSNHSDLKENANGGSYQAIKRILSYVNPL
jgi:hypothetical protein